MISATVHVGARSTKGSILVTKEGRKAQWNPTRNIRTAMVTKSTPPPKTHAMGPVNSAGDVINCRPSTATAITQAARRRERLTGLVMHESLARIWSSNSCRKQNGAPTPIDVDNRHLELLTGGNGDPSAGLRQTNQETAELTFLPGSR